MFFFVRQGPRGSYLGFVSLFCFCFCNVQRRRRGSTFKRQLRTKTERWKGKGEGEEEEKGEQPSERIGLPFVLIMVKLRSRHRVNKVRFSVV